MFTGIVQQAGTVVAARSTSGGRRFTIDAGAIGESASIGASIAVDGVCLTVCGVDGCRLDFDVIAETLRCTTLGHYQAGRRVNLEPSLRVGDPVDGHFVQGHVDGTAEVSGIEASDREWLIWLRPPAELLQYVVPKGSIAINGVSLTIADVSEGTFCVALIPTTLQRTNLSILNIGEEVNLETDILVRAVIHALHPREHGGGLTVAQLREQGYL